MLLWTFDQLFAEAATYTIHKKPTNVHAFNVIRTRNLRNRAAANFRSTPHATKNIFLCIRGYEIIKHWLNLIIGTNTNYFRVPQWKIVMCETEAVYVL
jgi:hypothetical protein